MATRIDIGKLRQKAFQKKDRKYIELQETLTAVTTAVSSVANLALKAYPRRKESIASVLPKEIRTVCCSQKEVTSWLFGVDLAQAIKEAKEMNKLSNEIATGKNYSKRQFKNPKPTQPQKGYKRPQNNLRQPAQQSKGFQQGREPHYMEMSEHP